jgi:uncharacterized repeat protein (TIGR01451 family)
MLTRKKMGRWFATACASLLVAGASIAAPDFNISAYNYDNQPTPLATNTTTTFRVTVGSVGDEPTPGTPVRVSIDVPAGVAVEPGSFPSYCVLKNNAPVSPSTLGTQILQCELPDGAIGGVGTSEEIAYVGRAVVPSNNAYVVNACIDNVLAINAAYPVTAAPGNCQPYPGDTDTGNDFNGTTVLINAANDLGISFTPAAPDNVISGAPYTFVANVTTNGLDPVPAGQVQAEFNVQPGFAPASSAAISAASPGWTCTVVGSKITCILTGAVVANPSGNTVTLAPINIPGTVIANGGTTGMDAAVASNDNTSAVADPRPANNGPIVKTLNISAGGNVKAEKSFVGQTGTATAALTGSTTVRIGASLDTGGAPMPAGATVTDDFSGMIAKGFVVGAAPAGCVFNTPIMTCTTVAALNPGNSVFFNIPLTNPPSPALPVPPTGINEAVVTPPSGYSDSNPTDNTKALPYLVLPPYTDLEVVPVVGARKVPLGGTITRGVVVQNNGPLPVSYGAANPLRAYGNIAPQENGGTGVPTCPPLPVGIWETCAVSGQRLLFTTGPASGTLAVGASTPAANFTSTAPVSPTAIGTGPSTEVCTGQRILDNLSIATSAGAQPPERTGAGGVNGPGNEYDNDCKNSRGIEYINSAAAAGDLQITKTVATLTAGQACDATTAGFGSVQTLASVASNDNALCFRMEVKNEDPNRPGVTWGAPGTYVHGPAPDYFITDTLPMYWGITSAAENLPSPEAFTLVPALNAGAGEVCNLTGPDIRCDLKNLGANATRTLYVRIARGMLDGTFINTATTDSKNLLEPDDVPGSTGFAGNTATATSIINPVIDLQVTGKALNPNPIPVGKLGQYIFTYRNLGPNPSQLAEVKDVIDTSRWEIVGTPVNTRGDTCSLQVGTPAAGQTTVLCPLSATPFERGQEFQVIIQVRPRFPYNQPNNSADGFSDGIGSPGYINPGSGLPLNVPVSGMPGYTNTAQITSTRAIETERSLTNNSNSVLVKVAPPRFDLITSKTDVGPGLNGDNLLFPAQVSYRITVVNSGESKTNGVHIVDLKPVTTSGSVPNFGTATAVSNNGQTRTLSLVSAVREGVLTGRPLPATACVDNTPTAGMIRCDITDTPDQRFLLPGESVSWLLTFDITPALPAFAIRGNIILPNRVRAASLEAPFDMTVSGTVDYDKDQVRNATENTTWFAPTDLRISQKQTITPSPVNLNQTAQFNITFNNNGPSPIRKVRITENLPPGFTFVSASFVKIGASLPGVAADYPVSCSGVTTVVCDIGNANSTTGDFSPGTTSAFDGQLQVIAKVTNWAAVQAAGFNPTNLVNTAVIEPGLDPSNDKPLGKDSVSTNNSASSTIAVLKTSISGNVCQVTQGTDLATAAAKNCTGTGGIPGATIKICGLDTFGNAIGGGTPGSDAADCASPITGVTSATGTWEILVPPGNYTIVESQPAGFSDYTEQAGTAGGTVVTGPNATPAALDFGPSVAENKIKSVPVLATGTVAQLNPSGYNFTEIVNTGLSGFVYEDLNNNGIKEGGEPGIQGVSIRLTGTDFDGNAVDVTVQTDSNGLYQFSVPPSNGSGYTLTQTQPSGYIDGKEIKGDASGAQTPTSVISGSQAGGNVAPGTNNAAKDTITGILLVEGVGQSQHNFGEIKTGTITGVVYVDSNGSVSKGPAEATLPNVTVTLTGTDFFGNPVSKSVQTNSSGTYAFGSLLPGDYTVTVAPVPGYTHTGASTEGPNNNGQTYAPISPNTPSIVPGTGTVAGGVSAPAVSTIKLGPGGVSDGNNFGERGSDISGRVCEDYNNDGICQAGEPGIGGVTITLSGTDAAGNAITRTAITSGTGLWVINDIPAPNGTGYTLEETQPSGFLDGRQSLGSLTPYAGGATTTPGTTTPTDVTTPGVRDRMTGIVFTSASQGVNYDFAEVRAASIQGFVYLDVNQNGARDAGTEPGITGVTIELTGTNDVGQAVSLTTTLTTSPDGSYSFANLRPGTYQVREVQPTPSALFDGSVTVGSVSYATSPTPTAVVGTVITEASSTVSGVGEGVQAIFLGSGASGVGYNFGEVPRLSISGRVILDTNANGSLDTGEANIPNVTTTVTLCRANENPCQAGNIVASTVTNIANGNYQFNDLPPGSYFVVEDQPIGYASSTANTIPVALTTTSASDRNFFETGAQISGTVYNDNNANGVLDTGDTAIVGASLRLCLTSQSASSCASSPIATATSLATGSYTFANVPAPPSGDSYVIVEDESLPPLSSIANGTATVGALTGGTSMVNGTIVASEQGPAFTGNSTINGISFVMPTTPATGTPVIGLGYNFGERPEAGISGRVFVDRDFTNGTTGTYNSATDTPLLNSATTVITLCSANPGTGTCTPTNVIGTVTTAADGTYNFTNIPAGDYWVIETQPVGYGSSSPNVQAVTRSGNTPVTDVNFADTLASISGRVYQDNDASGTSNTGDTGIGGVQISLCLSTGTTCTTVVQTTTSSVTGGTYTFVNLPAPPIGQSYIIIEGAIPAGLNNATSTVGNLVVGSAAAAPVGTADQPGSQINGITWTPSSALFNGPSAVGTDYNFGELPVSSISGNVILDRDFSGTNTAGDTALPVTTTLTLCRTNTDPCLGTNIIATTTSTLGGTYTFSGVTPGTYYVVQDQPAGYASSSANLSNPINITSTFANNVNFYETGARLSGTVYWDVDYSGAYNSGGPDVPLAGVLVRLCTDASCSTLVASATTTAAGLYQFDDVPAPRPGQSYVIVEPSTVFTGTTTLGDGTATVGSFALSGTGGSSNVGTANSSASRIESVTWVMPTSVVTGSPAVIGTNFNFGEVEGFDVSGRVYYDRNRNGTSDEPAGNGLNGVVITLCRVAGVPCTGTNIVGTTTTTVDGNYTFVKVPPGSYFMQESQPPGYGSTPTLSAPSATDVRPFTVTGAPLSGIDFADTLSSISGLVYLDSNGDQTLNPSETTRLSGITITLAGIDATGAQILTVTFTSAGGTYTFGDLKTGTYTITESQPPIYGNGAATPGSTGGTGGSNTNVITAISLPAGTDSVNNNFGDVPKDGAVSGSLWRDNNHDRIKDPGEPPLVGWTVQLLREPVGGGTPTLVLSTLSDNNGAYSFTGQEVGPGYSIRFIAPGGAIFAGAVNGENGTPIAGGSQVVRGELSNLTLRPGGVGNIIPQQSLPVDPAGVVYDSDTRLPVPGATVAFGPIGVCAGYNPAIHLVGGAANASQVVGPDGFYQFVLNPGAPACQYGITVTPPAGYAVDPAVPPQPTPFTPPNRPPNAPVLIVPNSGAPQAGEPTTWHQSFNLGPNSRDVVNNHVPLVASNRPVLFISKVAAKATVELGDNVKYTVKVRYVSGSTPLPVLRVVDSMPAGFKLIPGTSFASVPTGAAAVAIPAGNISGAPGAVVTYNIPLPAGVLNVGQEIELTYRVRVGVGSMQGDGINRAQATSVGVVRSNIAQARVKVNPGVFTSEACIVGKIFVDCNNNHIQDAEELGVPGVRLYLNDGQYLVSDSEGKYSLCGLEPKSHVLKVDQLTLPRGSRLTTTSNRNLGNADSLWLDLKNGEMQQADFAIGSCSNTVLEQVKARRAQGEVRSIDSERKTGAPLKFEGKSANYPDQGTDSANQPLVQPRPPGAPPPQSDAENNTPVPQLPAASSNTQGNNIRQTK